MWHLYGYLRAARNLDAGKERQDCGRATIGLSPLNGVWPPGGRSPTTHDLPVFVSP